ncbi:MAG TPA: transcription termination/antitermination NusG family protein [Actinomycetota bacterium]|nr:transcription termination/antitermination NusG family protein [Actinomycetota bacterium]
MPVAVETAVELATHVRDGAGVGPAPMYWYAMWTNSHCERLVHDQLVARGFDPFLPRIDVWARRGGERRVVSTPLFPGYLFLRHPAMTKASYIEIGKARGLVRMLGERWDRLDVVPDGEINGVRTVLDARVPVMPHPYLRDGQRVRIRYGPLTDVEGILIRTKPNKGLVVLRVALLQRSVAVEVDCTLVTPA